MTDFDIKKCQIYTKLWSENNLMVQFCVSRLMIMFQFSCAPTSWLMSWATDMRGLVHVNMTSPGTEYLTSLYWTAATMTSTGYGDIFARTNIGRSVVVVGMLTGLLLYGYCLALMAATLANADAPRLVSNKSCAFKLCLNNVIVTLHIQWWISI